jgi:hypothetical protein
LSMMRASTIVHMAHALKDTEESLMIERLLIVFLNSIGKMHFSRNLLTECIILHASINVDD